MNMELLSASTYEVALEGLSITSGEKVSIIGEQKVRLDDGRVISQYVYNIDGYTAQNGKPFISLKANIVLLGTTMSDLVGETFTNEVALEQAIQQIVDMVEMSPVLDGFWVKTFSGKMIKVNTTTTIGKLTVLKVK